MYVSVCMYFVCVLVCMYVHSKNIKNILGVSSQAGVSHESKDKLHVSSHWETKSLNYMFFQAIFPQKWNAKVFFKGTLIQNIFSLESLQYPL